MGKEEVDIQSQLLGETGVVVVLIPNSTMSTQPPYGVIHGGRQGILTVRGSNCFHMTTAGITPGPGPLRLPRSPSRGLVQTQQRVSCIKPENKSWVSKTIWNLMPMPYYMFDFHKESLIPREDTQDSKGRKNLTVKQTYNKSYYVRRLWHSSYFMMEVVFFGENWYFLWVPLFSQCSGV